MESIFSLIKEAEGLSIEEAKELFACEEEELPKILLGEAKPSLSAAYNINSKYGLSIKCMNDGAPADEHDEAILEELRQKRASTLAAQRISVVKEKLIDAGFGEVVESSFGSIFDEQEGLVFLEGLLKLDNYALYSFLRNSGIDVKNPPSKSRGKPKPDDWRGADFYAIEAYLNGTNKDPGFGELVKVADLSVASEGELSGFLRKYRNGSVPFDAEAVLRLLDAGAYVYTLVSVDVDFLLGGDNKYEKDVFASLWLKEYCKKILADKEA